MDSGSPDHNGHDRLSTDCSNIAMSVVEKLGGDLDSFVPDEPPSLRDAPHQPDAEFCLAVGEPSGKSARGSAVASGGGFDREPPVWLEPFMRGDLEIEQLAAHLAIEIAKDPRFMREAWWQKLLSHLLSILPERLLNLADRLAAAQARLMDQSAKESSLS